MKGWNAPPSLRSPELVDHQLLALIDIIPTPYIGSSPFRKNRRPHGTVCPTALPREKAKPWPPGLDYSKFCPLHRYPGHDRHSCFTLRDIIYDMNDQNRLDWNEIDAHVTGTNQGIYQNPLHRREVCKE